MQKHAHAPRQSVILDLNVDSKTHAAYGTVVASRVRSRHDVLIIRPFPAWLFQRGAAEGPELLLRKLRGEHIDWDAFREARWPKARCQRCLELKSLDLFAHAQWEKIRANLEATCLACQRQNKDGKGPRKRSFNAQTAAQKSIECSSCKVTKIEEAFPRAQLAQKNADKKRQCSACRRALSELTCTVCRTRKPAGEFAPSMCTMPDNALACLACQQGVRGKASRFRRGWFYCKGCQQSFPDAAAGNATWQHCLNCSMRATRQVGWQTCTNRKCKKRFQGTQKGPCPDCAHRAQPEMRWRKKQQ